MLPLNLREGISSHVPVVALHAGEIDLSPPYQRDVVWSKPQQEKFINSVLRGIDIPKLYFSLYDGLDHEGEPYESDVWRVMDRKQRLTGRCILLTFIQPVNRRRQPSLGSWTAGYVLLYASTPSISRNQIQLAHKRFSLCISVTHATPCRH